MEQDRDPASGEPPSFPTPPSGRLPQWVVDEAAGLPAGPVPWRADAPPPPRRAVLRGVVVVLAVLALALGAAVLVGPGSWPWGEQAVDGPVAVPSPPRPTDRPLPGAGAAPTPLGTPLPAPAARGAYAFVAFQEDGTTPVAYDPCRQVHYVLRPGAPPGGEEVVHAAFARLGQVTGLQFVSDGPSDEPLARGRAVYQPERYGDRWAPVLVGWQTEEENPELAGNVVGSAVSIPVSLGDGPRVYVTGTVSLDATELPDLLADPDDAPVVRGVVLHELGHVVGLAHVDDPGQLMYPEAQRDVVDFAAGDLTGLARLGAGPCVPDL